MRFYRVMMNTERGWIEYAGGMRLVSANYTLARLRRAGHMVRIEEI